MSMVFKHSSMGELYLLNLMLFPSRNVPFSQSNVTANVKILEATLQLKELILKWVHTSLTSSVKNHYTFRILNNK